ncbi:partition protein (plasmid) [Acinetobacter johnsonii]|uniref:Partition protein n=2 Tax=Acinetobacter johnsonii TaxID=40214 RepID=A0A3S9AQC6_ACIJO|nr:partition protein [Acinetobacter johnsonii]WNL65755.1 ParC family protein [Klebsiella oxytoca]
MIMDMNSVGVVGPAGFKELLAANSVQDTVIRCQDEGLVIALKVGGKDFVLGLSRGGVRYFRSFDAAASMLIQNGICRFESDLTGWHPRMFAKNKKGGNLLGSTGDEL